MEKNIQQKFARPRLLIVGCGDIGMRLLAPLQHHFRVFALIRDPARCAAIRAAGATPIVLDLDQAASIKRLAGLADNIIHLAPPAPHGQLDLRTRRLCAILPCSARLVYVSTSGVYGNCAGAWIDETQTVQPHNARAIRRVDAEQVLRAWARRRQGKLAIVRVPGIYASDRLPLARLQKATPALVREDDVFTNHIHADDLAQIILRALFRLRPLRIYHAVDDSAMKMADYFDAVADAFDLPYAPRMPRAQLEQMLSPAMLSFMAESRRLRNRRIKHELGVRLLYADVAAGLRAAQLAQKLL